MLLETSFHNSLQAAGATSNFAALFLELSQRYAESHRFYHTMSHIAAMLDLAREFGYLAQDRPALELAIWYHDAVYDPTRRDNELVSAALATRELARAGVCAERIGWIERAILATATHEASDHDTAVLMDLDLSILGAPALEFAKFESAIAKEYAFVPAADYQRGRLHVLRSFLARPQIFYQTEIRQRFEVNARENLASQIESLARQLPV